MDFSNRAARPVSVENTPNQVQPAHQPNSQPKNRGHRGFPFSRLAAAVVLFSATIVLAGLLALMVFGGNRSEAEFIKKAQFQAVFLDDANGQVYFGSLSVVNDKFYRLTDIFYVRVQQVQPEETGQEATQSISLAKLGNELHGPEDTMYIARDKVLFWENLKDDGQVVKAIVEYKKDPAAAERRQQESTNNGDTNNAEETNN